VFDNISHDLLLKAVHRHVKCKWALLFLERCLTTAAMEKDSERIERSRGTSQGDVLSITVALLGEV
jgi:RNA-directed DNA polymerase